MKILAIVFQAAFLLHFPPAVIAWMSPVKWRLNSSMGITLKEIHKTSKSQSSRLNQGNPKPPESNLHQLLLLLSQRWDPAKWIHREWKKWQKSRTWLGWRTQANTFFFSWDPMAWRITLEVKFIKRPKPTWTSPMVVVDLPSPSGVGVMPATTTYFPSWEFVFDDASLYLDVQASVWISWWVDAPIPCGMKACSRWIGTL